jgi:putative heme-binding domain-containing protein
MAAGNVPDPKLLSLLGQVLDEKRQPAPVRRAIVQALARNREGARLLLDRIEKGVLTDELAAMTGDALRGARWPDIRSDAIRLVPAPKSRSAEPLPPVSELIQRQGDANRGAVVFRRPEVGCANCHQVNGVGIDFGPKLSEIGTKLARDALYESILNPSSGISFGYEAWQIETRNGDELFGIVVSETAEELAIKAQTGVVSRVKKAEIARREQSSVSVMPSGLQEQMSVTDLVDLVEYLAGLKKPAS